MKRRARVRTAAFLLAACLVTGTSLLLVRSAEERCREQRRTFCGALTARLAEEADGAAAALSEPDTGRNALLSHGSAALALSSLLPTTAEEVSDTSGQYGAPLYRLVLRTLLMEEELSAETKEAVAEAARLLCRLALEAVPDTSAPDTSVPDKSAPHTPALDISGENADPEAAEIFARLSALSAAAEEQAASLTKPSSENAETVTVSHSYDAERFYHPDEAREAAGRLLGSAASLLRTLSYDETGGVYRFSCQNGTASLSARGGHLLHFLLAPRKPLGGLPAQNAGEIPTSEALSGAAADFVRNNGLRARLLPGFHDQREIRYFSFCREKDAENAPVLTVGVRIRDGAVLYYEAEAFYRR